ncbi:N-acetylmuramic acid 6-phosphate etherase [Alphaproteobacteria bacterium]|nr:N-acetylmuramic acid 6-phosphate etherase [Alphaproteobacteria bacterium]
MEKKIPPTELLEFNTKPLDKLNSLDALSLMLNSQKGAITSIQNILPNLDVIIDKLTKHLSYSDDGRIIYSGAGTSARIGVQDGVELYPTFGWPKRRLDFIIAGGFEALTCPVENAEDDEVSAEKMVNALSVCQNDVLISLAASGNTPFTCKVTEVATRKGALTLGISNNPNADLFLKSKLKILLDTGKEVVAGSTRLKAGTSQKICLNLISTIIMVNMGRVINGKMINLVATNNKLRLRKSKILKNT